MQSYIKELLRKNNTIENISIKAKQTYYKYFLSEEKIIRDRFKKRLGRDVNLKRPVKYNDKLQWLKLNWNDPLATQCADKYEVRSFIKKNIGEKYLNTLYGVYDNVDEINLENLPDKFVFKGTHGSGFNIICYEKKNMNWNKEFKKMQRWLKIDYYLENREWVYKGIKPRIICEKFIEADEADELKDYRFFCFNGDPKFVTVDFSITNKKKTRRNLYDLEWNLMNEEISYPKELNIAVERPSKLEDMISLSKKLSSNFPHARIDFYYVKGQIIFGEITFFHQSGMGIITPPEFEVTMGNWLELPSE